MPEYIEREATCKDCICYDVCFVVRHNGDDRVLRNSPCKHFRNKADVVEVRHGEWVHNKNDVVLNSFVCSICGNRESSLYPINAVIGGGYIADEHGNFFYPPKMNYCPNCGAKMDGKGE